MPLRIGYGYDVHRLVAGRNLMLGGVHIPFAQGLDGHSDADVLLHAVCDAILGALALGDIGVHFPDTDGRFKDIASLELLGRVVRMAGEKGYAVGNIDVSLVAERPKIAAYTGAIAASIAHTLDTLAGGAADTLDDLLEEDRQARRVAEAYLGSLPA